MIKRTCAIEGCNNPRTASGLCATHYRNIRLYGRLERRPDLPCHTCGTVIPGTGRMGVPKKYCSPDCDPRHRPRIIACKCCGCEFDRGPTSRVHCSSACMNRWRWNKAPIPERACVRCGMPIDFEHTGVGGRRRRLDALHCKDCRRQRHYKISVAELFERDGGVCGICGDAVEPGVLWPSPLGATRDHIIPVTAGGSHEPSNLQLAHFRCNVQKSNRVAVA